MRKRLNGKTGGPCEIPLDRGSISRGPSLFSHLLEETAHIIQTPGEGQLQCLTVEFAFPAGR
jgi:hypothetical protein